MKRTPMILGVAVVALGLTACGPQGGSDNVDYPTQNIELIVGFAPGGHNDTTARQFAELLEDELDQDILVVNREGGGGAVAATEAASAEPDGHTLLFAPTGAFTGVLVQQDVSYEIEDFRSIQPAAENPFGVAVPADSPFEDFEDLLEAEDRLTYSAFGEGHPTHLIGEGIVQEHDLDGHVAAYPGSPPALQAIVNGDVDFGIQDMTSALPRIDSGELRALAISSDQAPDALEDVPSLAEFGLEHLHFGGSQALVTPLDTPDEVVDRLTEAATAVVESEEYTDFVENAGNTIPDVGGEEWFSEFMPEELERTQTLFDQLGIED